MSSCTSAHAVEQFLLASEGESVCFPTDAELKHTLGNLTLVAGSLSPALSRSPWEMKKAELLRSSQPGLSRELHEVDEWAEREILARGEALAEVACGVWRHPVGEGEVS